MLLGTNTNMGRRMKRRLQDDNRDPTVDTAAGASTTAYSLPPPFCKATTTGPRCQGYNELADSHGLDGSAAAASCDGVVRPFGCVRVETGTQLTCLHSGRLRSILLRAAWWTW